MSIFGSIVSKIFGTTPAAAAEAAAPAASAPAETTANAGPAASAAPAAAAAAPVDVNQILTDLEEKHDETLDWKHSIVDLLKLLGLDSSLTARKTLADELHYDGDKNDSASMNVWLSKQVLAKLAENGGKLPANFG